MSTLQTLDRGIEVLDFVSLSTGGVSVKDVADHLGVHRAIAHRLVTTLAARGLLASGGRGRYRLGPAIPMLYARYAPHLIAAVTPVLRALADRCSATSFLCVADGEEAVVVAVEEPRVGAFRVAYRVGGRHPLGRGAAGLAILGGRPQWPGEPAALSEVRDRGWALTRGELQNGAVGVAASLGPASAIGIESCLGVVALGDLDVDVVASAVVAGAVTARAALGA